MKKRVLTLLLSCAILLSFLPVTALAASTPVYLYTLIPGVVQGSGNSADDEWNGMGVGTITGYEISQYRSGDMVSSDPDSLAANISFPSSFPDITVNGTSYQYAATGSANANQQGYYTIEWTRLVVSGGANAGNNGYNPTVSWNTNTFHLDGQLVLNETSYHTVSFALKDVGSNNFVVQSDYSVRVADGYSESRLTVPTFYNKYVNGTEYVFDGWYVDSACTIKAVFNGTIEQNTTYYARYNPTYTITYTDGVSDIVVFADQATSGLKYGADTPSFRGGTPDRGEDYIFLGWKAENTGDIMTTEQVAATTVEKNVTYYAQWEEKTYTVTWLDSDGTVLETDEKVKNGEVAAYNNTGGTTAKLAEDKNTAEYTYTFAGWTPEITAVNGANQFYRATYTTATNTYTVTWLDSDGTVLETDESVPYGTVPEYNGGENGQNTTDALAKAKSDADPTAHYTFAGWTPTVTDVMGNQTYTATYSKETEHYTIKWMNYGANKVFDLDSEVPYDSKPKDYAPDGIPERTGDSTYEYVFVGWTLQGDSNTKNIYYVTKNNSVNIENSYTYLSIDNAPNVVADQVYDAFYVAVERTYTGTVQFKLNDGLVDSEADVEKLIGSFNELYLADSDNNDYVLTGTTVNGAYVYQNTMLPQYTEFEVYADGRSLEHSFEIVQTDNTMIIRFYSVSYDADGGTLAGSAVEYHHAGETVTAQAKPTKEGYIFRGWDSDDDSDVDYDAGATVTDSIQKAYVLKAVWEDTVDVVINVHVNHTTTSGDNKDTNITSPLNIILTHSVGKGNITDNLNMLDYLAMVDPERVTIDSGTWYTQAGADITTYSYSGYCNLDKTDAYSANVTLEHYKLDVARAETDGTGKIITKNNGVYTVDVYLTWDAQGYDIPITVQMRHIKGTNTSVPTELYPDAIDFKITRRANDNEAWVTIAAHTHSSMDVAIGAGGTGDTFYHVLKTANATTYSYNIMILDVDVDGTTANNQKAETTTEQGYDYRAGRYFLDVVVENGANGEQIVIYIDVETHTITIAPNGGQWSNGSTSNEVFSQQTVVPDVSGYVPKRIETDNEVVKTYTFTGYTWYVDKNGNRTLDEGETTPVAPLSAGTALSNDYILVANWRAPLTVEGNITVDPSNTYGDTTYPTKVTVELRKYNGNETAFVTSQTVDVIKTTEGNNTTYTADYEFDPQPADLDYRVLVRIADYTQKFKNETASIFVADNGENEAAKAVDADANNIAQVDILLTYQKDAEFNLLYEVDTTAIGESFRPTTVKTRPWYYNGLSRDELAKQTPPITWEEALTTFANWKSTIADGAMEGHNSLTLDADGITSGSYQVEPYRPNGNAYNYAVYLYSVGDVVLSTNRDSVNYTVSYVAPAYFVQSTGKQDEMLKIILTPKKFDIIYMDGSTELHTITNGHTWSHTTNLKTGNAWNYAPTKSGFVFAGWYTDAALTTPAESIEAGRAADTTLYAKWDVDNWADAQADANDNVTVDSLTGGDKIPDNQQIHIHYTADANGSVTRLEEIVTISGVVFTDEDITASDGTEVKANAGYAFDKWEYIGSSDSNDNAAATVAYDAKSNTWKPTISNADGGKTYTFKATFASDIKGGSDGGNDGILDKYQLFIEYYSANTAWGSVVDSGNAVKQPVRVTLNAETGANTITGQNVIVAKTVPAANYAFDYWTQDAGNTPVNPATVLNDKTFNGNTTIKFYAHFAIDEWADAEADANDTIAADNVTGGDDIPDYKQALVRYVATTNNRGKVDGTGTVQVFTLNQTNGDGTYIGSVDPDDKNVNVTAYTGFAFDYWGDTDNYWKGGHGAKVDESKIFGAHSVVGEQIIVYTAHFGADQWKDEPDATSGGDNTPDNRQILITYVPDNVNHGTVNDQNEVVEVITLDSQTTITAEGVTAKAKDGYVFEGWSLRQRSAVEYDSTSATIAPKISGTAGGEVYTFTAVFAKDANKDTIPDKYQATVNYVSEDSSMGTVTVASEIVTILDENGQPDYVGTAVTGATGSTAQAKDGYIFKEWSNTHGISLAGKKDNATLSEVSFAAEAGKEYIFTVNFAPMNKKLTVTKTTTRTAVAVGETITWTIHVENTGNVKLTGITVVDTISIDGVPSATAKAILSDTNVFDLEPGAHKELTATYQVKQEDAGKKINNNAVATADDNTTDEDTPDTPVVVNNPGLTLTKTADKSTANVGETITYTIVVHNSGNTALTGISLTDTMVNTSGAANLYLADGTTLIPDGHAFDLAVDETATYIAKYVVRADDAGKTLKNMVFATTPDDGPTDQGESETTRIPEPYVPPVIIEPDPPKLNKEDHFAYVIGRDDGLVHPLDSITRAETATIFFRMLLEESRQTYWTQENNYVDVDLTDWFNNAISTLSNAGIITGRPSGYFDPYANITRAEFATLAIRFFLNEDVQIEENNLSDVKGHWAEANINLAYALGLITGYPDETFRPDQEITRAEAMVIVNRVLERHPDKDYLLLNMVTWPDNADPNIWYYADVQEATNSHLYILKTNNKGERYEVWQQLLPVRDWAILEKEWSDLNSSLNPGEVVDVNTGK